MRTKVVIVGALAVAFAGGWLVAGGAVPVQGQAASECRVCGGGRRKGRPRHHRPVRSGAELAQADVGQPARPRKLDLGLGAGRLRREPEPGLHGAARRAAAACSGRPPAPSPKSARASRSRSGRRRCATRRRVRRRARPAPAGLAPTRTIRSSSGRAAWASTRAGSTPSSSSTPPATSSSRGRSGTR